MLVFIKTIGNLRKSEMVKSLAIALLLLILMCVGCSPLTPGVTPDVWQRQRCASLNNRSIGWGATAVAGGAIAAGGGAFQIKTENEDKKLILGLVVIAAGALAAGGSFAANGYASQYTEEKCSAEK